MDHYYWGIEGWTSQIQEELYRRMVFDAKGDSHFVEVGSWKGRSTSLMAVEIINSGKRIKFDCVDTFMGGEEHQDYKSIQEGTLYQEFLKNIEPVKSVVTPIVGDSAHSASFYKDESLDFVFLDADHTYEGVLRDINAWLPKVKPGGILAGDDIGNHDHPGVHMAVFETLENISVSDKVWVYKKPKQIEHVLNVQTDEKLSLNYNLDRKIDKAYILCVEGHEATKPQLEKCIQSLKNLDMEYCLFYGYDGTDQKTIKTPQHLREKEYMKWFKLMDYGLSTSEVACLLGHIALWAHCITIDKPIIILEHDALMLKKYEYIPNYNVIDYLGHIYLSEEVKSVNNIGSDEELISYLKNLPPVSTSVDKRYPLLNITSDNYYYPMGFHAYAIDPMAAKNLFLKTLKTGLINPSDTTASVNDFCITHTGLFAVQQNDAFSTSTICPDMENEIDDNRHVMRKQTTEIPGMSRYKFFDKYGDFKKAKNKE